MIMYFINTAIYYKVHCYKYPVEKIYVFKGDISLFSYTTYLLHVFI